MSETQPRTSAPRLWLAELALLAVAFIWGVNIPIMKIALAMGIDRFALNGLRLIVSAVSLLIFAALERRKATNLNLRKHWFRVLSYAILVSGLYQLLFLLAVSQTTSADIALIMATVPLWTAIGARYFLNEHLNRLAWTGLLIAFAGTVLVTLQGAPVSKTTGSPQTPAVLNNQPHTASAGNSNAPASEMPTTATVASENITAAHSAATDVTTAASSRRFAGNVIALLAALAWSAGTILSRPVLSLTTPLQLAALSTLICLPMHLAVAGPSLLQSITLLSSLTLVLCLLYSGTLSTGLAMPLWSYGVRQAGAAHATMFQNLSPIIAVVSAWLILGEALSPSQAIGGSLILGGLFVMRRARYAPAPAPTLASTETK